MSALDWAERGWLPDAMIRMGIRRLCAQRLNELSAGGASSAKQRQQEWLDTLRRSPLAIETRAANEQHYELPPAFFELCLGPHRKYSACWFETGDESLADAELAMLKRYAERARLEDGQHLLELGCGWGSLTLWLAAHYPQARITAVSNSRPQREFIEAQCVHRGLFNVSVITCDVNQLQLPEAQFDRVISIEMFEHLRNYGLLFERIAHWLKPEGELFAHIFCHREFAYPFETEGEDNWMGRYFFTGGQMPAFDTFSHFQQDLRLIESWRVNGNHYMHTANAWLANQDRHADQVLEVLRSVYGDDAPRWFQRWRMFWMACAELFGYRNGEEWLVGHYRFNKQS